MEWPQFNESDLAAHLSKLESQETEEYHIVRVKIENTLSTEMTIDLEPQGSTDVFPPGAIYEIVALGKKDTAPIHLMIVENRIAIVSNGSAVIFNNGAAIIGYEWAGF
jgi:hypothetical protein